MTATLRELLDGLTATTVATTVVDVALVYYLIYRLLLTIRGTRAAQMVVGIVLVGAAFSIADRLELSTVSWLLERLISSFIILIIVVFQQDIRRALGRIGQSVMPFGRRQETTHTVDEVVAATAQLARARMGAIIVFERDAALEEFVDDATRIEAALSRQLLVSLFVPARDNELHDGAVVIGKSHRIELARALLPLSRATDLGPEFGTRHRAALGITEDTDAVSVVVSEERGEISLCFKGSIARDLEPVLLRRALVGLFAGGRATADMAEEAEAAAEVGKALATLGEPRPDPRADPRDARDLREPRDARDAREPRDAARIEPGSEHGEHAEAMR
ncbi:MAG TPA: diadenylate cyclase CdaA [Kofleriaceae bacterium]|nr:diadenylate cyclase CdaA [Kofleriaceae bacterium]